MALGEAKRGRDDDVRKPFKAAAHMLEAEDGSLRMEPEVEDNRQCIVLTHDTLNTLSQEGKTRTATKLQSKHS